MGNVERVLEIAARSADVLCAVGPLKSPEDYAAAIHSLSIALATVASACCGVIVDDLPERIRDMICEELEAAKRNREERN